jgi:hypothetical protein
LINPKDKGMKDFEDLSRKNGLISNYNDTFYVPLCEETLSSDETEVEKQKKISENFKQSTSNYELVLKRKMIKIILLKKAKCQKFSAKIISVIDYAEQKRKDGE